MPGYGFADKNNPQRYASKSKRRQRRNKRGHPRSQGDKPKPFSVSKEQFRKNHDAIDWSKAPWKQTNEPG